MSSSHASPCGCGAKPAPPSTTGTFTTGSGCGGACGGSCGCTGCGTTRAYVRPRFFAGQLLTEEDLGLLGDYVVAKNRLHNRMLWGEGVVCGLEVTCDPCSDGTVVVQPGYAINCCGDDIVVPCPVRVDILALVRELRTSKYGADCADPCEQPRPLPPPPPPPDPQPEPGPILLRAVAPPRAAAPRIPAARYYLYVRYLEEPTDPVSPFATDEPCAHLACEPTRIAERFRFELRCERTPLPWMGLGQRFTECLGDIVKAASLATRAVVIRRNAELVSRAVDALARTPQPRFMAADHTALRSATERLTHALAELEPRDGETRALATTPATSASDLARATLDAARETGSLVARLAMTPTRERPQDPGTVSPALAALERARRQLPRAIDGAGFEELERETAKTALEFVGRWRSLDQPPEPTYSDLLFAFGATMDDALYARYRVAHDEMLSFAAAAIVPRRVLTDCELRAAFGLLGPLPSVTFGPTAATILAAQGQAAAQVLLRLYFDCLCDALNPPCQTCDDPGVLLAEICIRDCVVTDICNLVRRFVITWQSVRYWTDIPSSPFNINALGRAMERICCELRGALGGGCAPVDSVGGVLRRVSVDARTFARLESGTAETTTPTTDEAMFADLFTSLERLAGAAAPEPSTALETADPRAVAALRDELSTTRRDLEALRRQVESLRN